MTTQENRHEIMTANIILVLGGLILGGVLNQEVGALFGAILGYLIAQIYSLKLRLTSLEKQYERWPGLFGQDLPSFKWNVAPVYAATFCGSVFQ